MKNKVLAMRILPMCALILLISVSLSGCSLSGSMKDGYYTAQMKEYNNGWKEYVCIQVKNDVIVSAEFNARNASGFIKAWDNSYMKTMKNVSGTYPNQYTREYVQQLIEQQKNLKVDAVSGASNSGGNFTKLVHAVLEQAKAGDSTVVVVE